MTEGRHGNTNGVAGDYPTGAEGLVRGMSVSMVRWLMSSCQMKSGAEQTFSLLCLDRFLLLWYASADSSLIDNDTPARQKLHIGKHTLGYGFFSTYRQNQTPQLCSIVTGLASLVLLM